MDRCAALLLTLVVLTCACLTVDVLASMPPVQPEPPTTVPATMPVTTAPEEPPGGAPPAPVLATIGGIIGITITIVELIKRYGGNIEIVKNMPTFLINIIVATILTIIAKYALHTIDGDIGDLLFNVALAAGGATALHTTATNMNATPLTFLKAQKARH